MVLDNLCRCQVWPVGGSVTVQGNNSLEAKRQSAADCGINAKLGGEPCNDQLGHLPFSEPFSKVSPKECVAGFLPNAQIIGLHVESGIQGMTRLRRMKRMAFGARVLHENHWTAARAKPLRQSV